MLQLAKLIVCTRREETAPAQGTSPMYGSNHNMRIGRLVPGSDLAAPYGYCLTS